MRPLIVLLISSAGLFGQGIPQPGGVRYQPTYEEAKAALGLTDDQLTQLKQIQQEKMTATQSFYTKMADKQKELNQLLESNSTDAAKVGQLMLDLQQLRKQPPPGATDTHERAVGILNADQKKKLAKVEEAQKLRAAVDQSMQLGLIVPPAVPSIGPPRAPFGPGAPGAPNPGAKMAPQPIHAAPVAPPARQ